MRAQVFVKGHAPTAPSPSREATALWHFWKAGFFSLFFLKSNVRFFSKKKWLLGRPTFESFFLTSFDWLEKNRILQKDRFFSDV